MMILKRQISIEKKQIFKNTFYYLSLFLFSFFVDYFLNSSIHVYSVVFFFMFVILFSFSKRLFYFSVLVSGILTALYIPVMLQYGPPSFSMSVAMFYTHDAEAWSFITKFPIEYYFLSCVFIAFTLFVASRDYYSIKGRFRIWIISVTVLYIFIFPIYMIAFKNEEVKGYTTLIHYGPIKFVTKNIQFFYQVNREDNILKSVLAQKDSWEIEAVEKKKDMQIVVIGESVRRDFMHAYGFKIKNTPFMSSSKGVKFDNFFSAGSSTIPSLFRMLCENNQSSYNIGNNIISLAQKAGLYTYWFSNQGNIGKYDTPISGIARFSDDVRFLNPSDHFSVETKDDELLPWIEEAIEESSDFTQLIIVHLIGSHSPFCKKTDGRFDEFFLTDEISCYVQSIKNTDKLLNEIYTTALNSQKSFNMLYFSDHGLNFTGNNELVHGGKYKQNYDVPLFLWSDDAKSSDTISVARSGMDFLTLVSELCGIKEKRLVCNYRFISNDVAPSVVVINNNEQVIDYSKLGDDGLY